MLENAASVAKVSPSIATIFSVRSCALGCANFTPTGSAMPIFAARIASRPLDLLLLSAAATLWIVGMANVWDISVWSALCFLGMVELLLLGWSAATSKGRWRLALRFTLTTQLTVASRIMVAVFGTMLIIGMLAAGVNMVAPDPFLDSLLRADAMQALLLALFNYSALSIPFYTMWILHALRGRGLALADLASGAFLQASLRMASPATRVQQRLDFYLRALASDMSAPLPTAQYGVRPTLTHVVGEDGKALYACVWTWLPVKLLIEVLPDGEHATVVNARCVQRGGYYRHEPAVLPTEAFMLLDHVQAHVLQPLRTDMSQHEAQRRQETLRVQAMEMRLKVLQAQVEPHFLFNTMANLRHLYRSDVIAGEAMLDHLISYLRGAMDGLRSEQSTVGAELELIRHYLALMKVRMGSRLSYTFIAFDEIGHYRFPPAMLISLVENAIKHGLQDRHDGQLRITAAREDDKLMIRVIDNGPGLGSIEGTGVGLSNIRQRLEAIYGHAAWLEAGATADGGFVATIVVPA